MEDDWAPDARIRERVNHPDIPTIYPPFLQLVFRALAWLGGGLTTWRLLLLVVEMGLALTIEDTWGGDIVTAAIAHLAQSTPERYRFTATDFNSYVTRSIANGAPRRKDGRMAAPQAPGLGVVPRAELLGAAVFETG